MGAKNKFFVYHFAVCLDQTHGKLIFLPCAQRRAHGKFNVHRMAVTRTPVCRVPDVRHTTKISTLPCDFICRVLVCEAHNFLSFCRVPRYLPWASRMGTRQILYLPCALLLPCVYFSAHGKGSVCRVPDIMHTANMQAHGKHTFFGSDICVWPSPGHI